MPHLSSIKPLFTFCTRLFLCWISLLLFSTLVFAQTDDGKIENNEIVIEKNRKIELPESGRLYEKIPLQKNKNIVPEAQKYDFKDYIARIADPESKTKVLTIKEEEEKKLYGRYVKGAFGNYTTPLLEVYLNNTRNAKYQAGISGRHLSSANGPVNNSGSSNNNLRAYGRFLGKKAILSGSADYTRNTVYFYGYDQQHINESKSSIQQIFNIIALKGELKSTDSSGKIPYHLSIGFNQLNDHYKASESEFWLNLKGKYRLDGNSGLEYSSDLSLSKRTDSTSINRALFGLGTQYYYLWNKFTFKGGLGFAAENDTAKNMGRAHLFPLASAEYELAAATRAYVMLDGQVEKKTLAGFVRENPYLGPNVALSHQLKLWEVSGGIKGNISSLVNYHISAAYASYKNYALFLNSPSDSAKFIVGYDVQGVNQSRVTGELSYNASERFQLGLRTTFYQYQTHTFEKAWNKPAAEATASARYNLYNKLFVSADLYYIGGLSAITFPTNREYQLKDIIDLNIGFTYKTSDRFSIFLNFYNITSQNYSRYLFYPSKGFNFLGGFGYSF